MRREVALVVLLVLTPATASASPQVVEVYPDTYAEGDAGEYVVVEFNRTDTTGWTLTDGEDVVRLPNATHRRLNLTGGSLGDLRLANSGDSLVLRNADGDVVDSFGYGDEGELDPSEGEVIVREDGDARLRHVGASSFDYAVYNASVRGFVAPDSSASAVENVLDSADSSVLVSAFTFDSGFIADSLADAERRGVDVRVLVEGVPPGGFDADDARVLDRLEDAGAEVDVVDGERRRYRFFHAKYAVVDNETAVVTSENWERGSMSLSRGGSRGWGVVVESDGVARRLASVFSNDTDWSTVHDWDEARPDTVEGDADDSSRGPATSFEARDFGGSRVGVVLAPDDSVDPVLELIRSADETLYVQQAYVHDWDDEPNPYLEAVVERARDGVEVRVLLDGRWYNREENTRVVERLNRLGDTYDVEARLSEVPVHNKGVVADGESVLVSSINWNRNSVTNNREVGVVVHNDDAAAYFSRVFESDWDAGRQSSGFDPSDHTVEIALIVVNAAIGAWLVLRRLG